MKISVLTPSFNSGRYIEKAINSVLNQNYHNYEHIIVDGGSTDNTICTLKRYKHLNWISEPDQGQSDAMNKAFEMSTGDIIVYLNADDYFEPNIFQYIIDYFNHNKETDVLVGNLYNRFFNKEFIVNITSPETDFKKIILPFKYQFPYNPVSYFYKRNVQDQIGLFPINEHFAMDYWFLIRAYNLFKIKKTGLVFGTFFRTGFNKTSTSKKNPCNNIALTYCKLINKKHYYLFNYYIFKIYKLKNVPKLTVKFLYHMLFFRKKMSFNEFINIGYKKIKQR